RVQVELERLLFGAGKRACHSARIIHEVPRETSLKRIGPRLLRSLPRHRPPRCAPPGAIEPFLQDREERADAVARAKSGAIHVAARLIPPVPPDAESFDECEVIVEPGFAVFVRLRHTDA